MLPVTSTYRGASVCHLLWVHIVCTNLIRIFLLQDKIGVFVDSKGKLIHPEEGNLSWSEAPGGVVLHPPYALARLSRFIEVRSILRILCTCIISIQETQKQGQLALCSHFFAILQSQDPSPLLRVFVKVDGDLSLQGDCLSSI